VTAMKEEYYTIL